MVLSRERFVIRLKPMLAMRARNAARRKEISKREGLSRARYSPFRVASHSLRSAEGATSIQPRAAPWVHTV